MTGVQTCALPIYNDDRDASSTDEISTWHSYPLSLVTKRGSSFGYESSDS